MHSSQQYIQICTEIISNISQYNYMYIQCTIPLGINKYFTILLYTMNYISSMYPFIIMQCCQDPIKFQNCTIVLAQIPWLSDFMSAYDKTSYCLTHWGRDIMDAISQTPFSNAFSWMKIFQLRLKFPWSLFLRFQSTIFQHCFNGTRPLSEPMIVSLPTHICVIRLQWVKE